MYRPPVRPWNHALPLRLALLFLGLDEVAWIADDLQVVGVLRLGLAPSGTLGILFADDVVDDVADDAEAASLAAYLALPFISGENYLANSVPCCAVAAFLPR